MKVEVIEGIRQYPIKLWLDGLLQLNVVSESERSVILDDDAKKFEKLLYLNRTLNVPVQKFASIPGNRFCKDRVRRQTDSLRTQLYDVRMVPDSSTDLKPFRIHGLSLDEVVRYVEERLKAPRFYRIFLAKHYKPSFSGTIISNSGDLLVELVEGQHLHLTQAGTKPIYRGYWEKYRMSYDFCGEPIRRIIWYATQMICFPRRYPISPLNPPFFFEGYFEFIYDNDNRFIVTDYSRKSFFSRMSL